MYAKNVTERNLKDIAAGLKFEATCEERGDRIMFTLRNKGGRYWKIHDGRVKQDIVCYHGHYLFLHSLFDVFPNAVIEASFYKRVKYTAENYQDEADDIGNIVIREFDQLRPRDLCNCEQQDWYNPARSC